MTIDKNTEFEIITELEFRHSKDRVVSAADLQGALTETDLTVIQGFGDEFAYYLVRETGPSDDTELTMIGSTETFEVVGSRSEASPEVDNVYEVTD